MPDFRLPRRPAAFAVIFCLAVGLSACESSEDRADAHFESGVELADEGDLDRAVLEFRNALRLDVDHIDARRALARVEVDRGNSRAAYGHYLRIAENLPEDPEARIALAEMAFEARNWSEFERHAPEAIRLAGEGPEGQAIEVALDYRQAVIGNDSEARRQALAEAEALRDALPKSMLLRRVRIDGYASNQEFEKALSEIDEIIADQPEDRDALDARLQLLAEMGDMDAVAAQLEKMLELYPDEPEMRARLVRFYLARNDLDAAESVLRRTLDPASGDVAPYVELVQFLAELRTPEEAETALEEGIAARAEAGQSTAILQAVQAGRTFDAGERDEAVAQLEAILAEAEAEDSATTDEEVGQVKVILARVEASMGNEVAARRIIEELLETDPSNVEALKMRAGWQIGEDDVDGAVTTLRTVLDVAPEDAEAMTLMAEAHSRGGNHELARDFLSLAVEASGNAPAESIRYAGRLIEDGRTSTAEEILITSLRLAPGDEGLLSALGELYVTTNDIPRARQVVETLRRLETESARQIADGLEAELVNQSQGLDEAISFLDGLAESGDSGARLAAIRARLATQDIPGASSAVEDALAADPDDAQLRALQATIKAVAGDTDAAEAQYREILDNQPELSGVRMQLVRLLAAMGQPEDARAVIDEGLENQPDNVDLLWAKASFLEQDGDIEGAIEIYETLYGRLSGSPVIANNLASLLSTWNEDEESLDRAYTVARRLRGTDVPAFQDTYGWILHRRGEHAEALEYLEPAAEGLGNDPLVQYHLAEAYLALDRSAEALAQFRQAVEVAGEIDTRPQIVRAREEIARLQAQEAEGTE